MSDKERLAKLDAHVGIEELKGHIVSNIFHIWLKSDDISLKEVYKSIDIIADSIEFIIDAKLHEKVAKD